jgi:hypothetical protein
MVKKAWYGVKADGHAAEVLKALDSERGLPRAG